MTQLLSKNGLALVFTFLLLAALPAAAATITVTSSADVAANDGVCTLREAITAANTDSPSGGAAGECAAGSGSDAVAFAIPGVGPHIISVAPTKLPDIIQPLAIDGYTQSGAAANTLAQGSNAVIAVGIDGGVAGYAGLTFQASGSVRGLQITRFQSGITILLGSVTVAGNFIGTDGSSDLGNFLQGVAVFDSNGVVGGAAAADRNVISGNDGSAVAANTVSGVLIRNNLINTDRSGTSAIAGSVGIQLSGSSSMNQIVDNVVGATDSGITVSDDSNQTTIASNRVGVDLAGGNIGGSGWGISLIAFDGSPDLTQVGGLAPAERNIIHNWGSGGIRVDRILATTEPNGNVFWGNSLFGNGFGIDLIDSSTGAGVPGVNPNDPGDADLGTNDLQNYPVLLDARWDGIFLLVDFDLDSTPNRNYRIEFFASSACGTHSEGETFVGSADVALGPTGIANVTNLAISGSAASGFLTATATDLTRNNTSEFSNCVAISQAPAVVVPTLNGWGLSMLALAVALAGWLFLARRQ